MVPLISVCIPTYEMSGLGEPYLKHSLEILQHQNFKNFDVVVSDNSKDDKIKILCSLFEKTLNITYLRNDVAYGISANLNNAIKHANGKILKILFQDDFLYSNESLHDIADAFDLSKDCWLVTSSEHSHDGKNYYRPYTPKINKKLVIGVNTISSPSVLSIKNISPKILFDENLTWLMDCDYYYRCNLIYGDPVILKKINVVNRTGSHQVTNTLVDRNLKKNEFRYIFKKYGAQLSPLNRLILFIKFF